ncbi:MAG: hypothetical protein RLZ04_1358 [Actinomycetota bacterium]
MPIVADNTLHVLDTDREVTDLVAQCWRGLSPAQRLLLVADLGESAEQLSLAGVRLRHPDASEEEVRLRAIALRIGRELMVAAYDWDPEIKGW